MSKKPQKVGFGKCIILIKDLDTANAGWNIVPTPADGTTQLTPTKGNKLEASIEGGKLEDSMYGENQYALAYQIRKASNREMPIKHVNGIVDHNYAVAVIPRKNGSGVPGCYIANSTVSVEDSFSTADGGTDLYTHEALALDPDNEEEKLVKWGEITYEKSEDGTITLKGKGGDFSEEAQVL